MVRKYRTISINTLQAFAAIIVKPEDRGYAFIQERYTPVATVTAYPFDLDSSVQMSFVAKTVYRGKHADPVITVFAHNANAIFDSLTTFLLQQFCQNVERSSLDTVAKVCFGKPGEPWYNPAGSVGVVVAILAIATHTKTQITMSGVRYLVFTEDAQHNIVVGAIRADSIHEDTILHADEVAIVRTQNPFSFHENILDIRTEQIQHLRLIIRDYQKYLNPET